MFKNAFSFNGRIKRTEFGLTVIIYTACYIGIQYVMDGENSGGILGLLFLLYIPMAWFLYAQGAKRCHDLNKSGWWQIIPFYFFVLLFTKGNPWPNQYDVPGSEVFYGANDYERPFDVSEGGDK